MASTRAPHYAGIDIGGTKLHAVIADSKGRVLARARKKVGSDKSFGAVMDRMAAVVDKACGKASMRVGDLAAIGIGAPSPVLPDGTAVRAPNLGWDHVPLTSEATRRLGRPCYAANDCDAGTYGETRFGAARGARTAVGLFMGTGLGGGIVHEGRILCGDNHQAAEVGHMVVVKGGERCGCGRRGCLEAYASKTAMARRFARELGERGRTSRLTELAAGDASSLRSSVLAQAYREGDALTVEVVDEAAEYLGVGVGNLITLLGPSVVVLGGGVLQALGTELLGRITTTAATVAFPPSSCADTSIELAALGDDAVARGALAFAAEQHRAA